MPDTTIKIVEAASSPHGNMGQKYLVSGKSVSMRLWEAEPPGSSKPATRRDHETVGYVVSGRAELHLEGQKIALAAGDSWLVPREPSIAITSWSRSSRSRRRRRRPRSTPAMR